MTFGYCGMRISGSFMALKGTSTILIWVVLLKWKIWRAPVCNRTLRNGYNAYCALCSPWTHMCSSWTPWSHICSSWTPVKNSARSVVRSAEQDRDNRGGASDSGGEPEGNGGRLSGISRAHIVGGELEGTSDPGGELEGTSEPAENDLSKEKTEQR